MAHTNNLIYVDTSGSIPVGVSIYDIQSVLGSSLNDIGRLITEGGINKWAKYKPIKRAGLQFNDQLDTDFTWKSTATWWKGTNGQCGMTFATFNSLGSNTISTANTFLYELISGNLGWGYERPTGGVNAFPFRFFDFNQYDHSAPKPVSGVYDNLQLYGGGKLTVRLDEGRAGDARGVQLSDLNIGNLDAGGFYVGILIYKSASQFTFAFSENTIGGVGEISVEFTGMTAYGGQSVQIVPFLSSVRSSQGIDPGSGVFLSCDVAPQTVTIGAEVQQVVTTIYAQWRDSLHGRVHYDVNIINNTTSAITVTNIRISLYDGYQDNDYDTVASVTIPARSAQSYSGTLMPTAYDPDKAYTVKVTSDHSGVSGEVSVDDPRT